MLRTAQTAPAFPTAVRSCTRKRLRALKSMSFSIMAPASVLLHRFGMVREGGQRRPESGFGIDEEVRGGHHLLALGDAGEDLAVSLRVTAEGEGAGLEPPFTLHDEG